MTAAWRAWWAGLSRREQWLLGLVACALVGLLVWTIALAPALRTLASAPATLQQLDAQAAAMQMMAAEAASLRQRSAPARAGDAVRQLESTLQQRLGPGAALEKGSCTRSTVSAVRTTRSRRTMRVE